MSPIEPAHPVDLYVGRRFRALRKAAGFSQGAVGERLGITFQQVQKYENGANRISASKLYEAAQILGVRIEAFFDGFDDRQVVFEASAQLPLSRGLESPTSSRTRRMDHDAAPEIARIVGPPDRTPLA